MGESLASFLSGPHARSRALIAEETRLTSSLPINLPLLGGIRAGALLLLVGGFEHFVNQALREWAAPLEQTHLKQPMAALPEAASRQALRLAAVYLQRLTDDKSEPQASLAKAKKTATLLGNGNLVAAAFGLERPNPNPVNLSNAFKALGVNDVLRQRLIRQSFETAYGTVVTPSFLWDKLNEIVRKRHIAAHTGTDAGTTGVDLAAYADFLVALSRVLDEALDKASKQLVAYCT